MIRTISYAALALFLVSAPAGVLAQDAPANDPAAPPPLTALPDTTAKESPPQPIEGQIVNQDTGTLLASTVIGGNVYSPSDESVGHVNDLVLKPTGEIEAVVVGVGGFIGIGEKDVAIALNRFTLEPSPDFATTKLVLNATKEELEAAPPFKSAYVQKLDEEYERQTALGNKESGEPGQYPAVPAPQQ
ncbi:MAG: PRC-barrel domain-containing protein [Aestuariivirga sp.]|nr:PRC-barrel domain-containing protein [Aestuariivirga sp.]